LKNLSDYQFERNSNLESENFNLINENFNLKKEIANLSLEKSFFEFRFKDQEKINKSNYENLINKSHEFEKLMNEAKKEIEGLIKKNNNYEKELYKMDEISKLNENLKLNNVELENQINSQKKCNQGNLNTIEKLKNEISQKNLRIKEIENEMLEKMNYSSSKLLQNERDIKNLNSTKIELTNKLENLKANEELIKKQEKDIYDLNYKIFNCENELKNKFEENERIRLFIKENLIESLNNDIQENNLIINEILENINNYNKDININFDQLICLIFKK